MEFLHRSLIRSSEKLNLKHSLSRFATAKFGLVKQNLVGQGYLLSQALTKLQNL